MELSDENFTIAVDSAKFVAHPEARITLEGARAILNYALSTGEHEKLNFMLCKLLTVLMFEYKQKHQKGGWGDKNNGW